MPRQRVGIGSTPGAEGARDRRSDRPHPPADIVCISMMRGKTRDTPASASAPSQPTKAASAALTPTWMTGTTTVGAARPNKVAAMGPSSRAGVVVGTLPELAVRARDCVDRRLIGDRAQRCVAAWVMAPRLLVRFPA
jgi:hypothetical protein